jgi:hypothetical protein
VNERKAVVVRADNCCVFTPSSCVAVRLLSTTVESAVNCVELKPPISVAVRPLICEVVMLPMVVVESDPSCVAVKAPSCVEEIPES